ncbi:uncharacterized protein LOC126906388 isoform X2 [Daktulosphaira vitifoliae]|uniref:uncharacterized protein LOC126906388 isoform X2 n=1 Tax=Daktulosphaira vitifoliae TaxID=58002 RepID=UPI0021AAD10D|nr:uncharacterized protein LOC126906388 isoform X2 [Daktulosphaira vitifoliae]
MTGMTPYGLWGHPPLPPGKRVLNRSISEDRKPAFGGFMRRFSSVRRNGNNKKDNMADTTYESFDSLFDDNDIILVGTEFLDERPKPSPSHANCNRRPLSSLFRSRSDGNLARRKCIVASGAGTETKLGLSKYFKALSGSWKNLLNISNMNKTPKNSPQVKKVAPPAIPDLAACRHSGSSFGSTGYSSSNDDAFIESSSGIKPDIYDTTESYYPIGNKSPSIQYNHTNFTFPGSSFYSHPIGNMKTYYHQLSLQEDQGIDMTQSPGRDSPGSSGSGSGSRYSTASLDSGRASGCNLKGNSYWSHELNPSTRVERLLHQGVPEKDILYSWLVDLHLEEYLQLFLNAGYDMRTISKMTPEDLTAIGVKKPNHRKKLKAEIGLLNISDGLPDHIPGSLNEWLKLLRLEEYASALKAQGYSSIDDVTQLTWEDLEDIGIVKLGHQKRLLLAIKRVKDIKAGKLFSLHSPYLVQTQACIESPLSVVSSSSGCGTSITNSSCGTESVEFDFPRVHATYHSFHQPWELESSKQLYCQTDIVPIKVRGTHRGKSLESLHENNNATIVGGTSSFVGVSQWKSQQKSFEDGDITPTNETSILHESGRGGTLPRPRGLVKPRLVARIPALFTQTNTDEYPSAGTLKRRPPSPPKRQLSIESTDDQIISVDPDKHIPLTFQLKCSNKWNNEVLSPKLSTDDNAGSNASFKSTSSAESDSIPFANENAGTIKPRTLRSTNELIQPLLSEGSHPLLSSTNNPLHSTNSNYSLLPLSGKKEPADVLNDIGNMLANLTDELDAMLEEEKRQGLND